MFTNCETKQIICIVNKNICMCISGFSNFVQKSFWYHFMCEWFSSRIRVDFYEIRTTYLYYLIF